MIVAIDKRQLYIRHRPAEHTLFQRNRQCLFYLMLVSHFYLPIGHDGIELYS